MNIDMCIDIPVHRHVYRLTWCIDGNMPRPVNAALSATVRDKQRAKEHEQADLVRRHHSYGLYSYGAKEHEQADLVRRHYTPLSFFYNAMTMLFIMQLRWF